MYVPKHNGYPLPRLDQFALEDYYVYNATDLLCQRRTPLGPTGVARCIHSALIFIREINGWKNTTYRRVMPFSVAIRVTAKFYFFWHKQPILCTCYNYSSKTMPKEDVKNFCILLEIMFLNYFKAVTEISLGNRTVPKDYCN